MKRIIIKGVLTSLPLIVIAQLFFYLSSRSNISKDLLIDIKPILYGLFLLFAIGLPVYFYFTVCGKKILKMLLVIVVSWAIFSLQILLSAGFIYGGLAKDIEFSLINVTMYFFTDFILGIGIFSPICVSAALIIERLFYRNLRAAR